MYKKSILQKPQNHVIKKIKQEKNFANFVN